MDGVQVDVNPSGVATTTANGFLTPACSVGAIHRTKYGPNARRTSTPEINVEENDVDQQISDMEAANQQYIAETACLKKQMETAGTRKSGETAPNPSGRNPTEIGAAHGGGEGEEGSSGSGSICKIAETRRL